MNDRAVERALLMHGTSWPRERVGRLLGRIVSESGSRGAAFGTLDPSEPSYLIPVCAIAGQPGIRWDARLKGTVTRLTGRGRQGVVVPHGARCPPRAY